MSLEASEDIKRLVVESLPLDCREVGTLFFTCLEKSASETTNLNEKQYESFMTSEAIPNCLSQYNLEECLLKNQQS